MDIEKEKPLISFMITVYNLEKYIARCIESILAQDFDNFEIILADNASSDRSPQICREYAEKYPGKIRFFEVPKEIARMGAAHWFAFQLAHGKYVQYIDGDDALAVNCIPKIVKIIKEKEPDIVMGRFECRLEGGAKNKHNFNDALFEPERINNASYDDAMVYLSTLPNFQGVLWRYVFKKSIFERNYKESGYIFDPPFQTNLYGDIVSLMRLFLKANSIYFLDQVIYLYTRRENASGMGFIAGDDAAREAFISFLNALYILTIFNPSGGKYSYILQKTYFLFKFFKLGINRLNEEQLKEISVMIDENRILFEVLRNCEINDLRVFFSLIEKHGSHNGLFEYCQTLKDSFLMAVKNKHWENGLYIIPAGNKTIATIKLLADNGIVPNAIFDNDPTKNGHTYENVQCFLPSFIESWDSGKKNTSVFVISALDESLSEILKSQLLGLGIKENQIIIKE